MPNPKIIDKKQKNIQASAPEEDEELDDGYVGLTLSAFEDAPRVPRAKDKCDCNKVATEQERRRRRQYQQDRWREQWMAQNGY